MMLTLGQESRWTSALADRSQEEKDSYIILSPVASNVRNRPGERHTSIDT